MEKEYNNPFDFDVESLRIEAELMQEAFLAEEEQAAEMQLILHDVMADAPYFLGEDPDAAKFSSDYRYDEPDGSIDFGFEDGHAFHEELRTKSETEPEWSDERGME